MGRMTDDRGYIPVGGGKFPLWQCVLSSKAHSASYPGALSNIFLWVSHRCIRTNVHPYQCQSLGKTAAALPQEGQGSQWAEQPIFYIPLLVSLSLQYSLNVV